MTTYAGLDAYGAIPPDELGAYDFVGRYVAQQVGKCITASEVAGYRAAKKSIILVYEDDAEDGLGGANMGAAKAILARPILAAIGWPTTLPVHFAFDMPGYSQDLSTFVACAQAFAAGIGRPAAVYGDVDTCTYAHEQGIKYLWQFGEDRAPGITVLQGPSITAPWGQSVDPDTALAEDYGQWAPDPPKPPAPKPTPSPKPDPPTPVEDTVTLTDVVVDVPKGDRQALKTTSIAYAEVVAVSLVEGTGSSGIEQATFANAGGKADIVVHLQNPAAEALSITVRVASAD